MKDSLHEDVAALLREVAADIVLPRFRALRDDERWEKSPGEIVTVVDREAEARLAGGLQKLLPDSRVVGEEAVAADSRLLEGLNEGTVWLVDPLDGTANFVAGSDQFSMMVALVRNGETVASWMLDPVRGELAFAELGGGASLGSRWLRASEDVQSLDLMRGAVLTGFLPQSLHKLMGENCARFAEVLPGMRCAGHEYPAVACGVQDFALFWRTLPWDHAPGVLFLSEAGGKVARLDGRPYRPADKGSGLLLARNEAVWRSVHACLFTNIPQPIIQSMCGHDRDPG